jgi:hypothetical protein
MTTSLGFVCNARPDVERFYQEHPFNARGGGFRCAPCGPHAQRYRNSPDAFAIMMAPQSTTRPVWGQKPAYLLTVATVVWMLQLLFRVRHFFNSDIADMGPDRDRPTPAIKCI